MDGNDIWEMLFSIMKGDVPDALTVEVLEQLADALKVAALTEAADEISSLRARVEVKDRALTLIAERAEKLKAGTDDWFEMVEFSILARQALKDSDNAE